MSILVVGSFMMDLVTKTPVAPNPGQTVIGTSFNTFLGGKGANQAVAAARLGSFVTMAGMVGNDDFGNRFIDFFKQVENMDSHAILRGKQSTGVGCITIDGEGQNKIVVIPGANMDYSINDLYKIKTDFKKSNVVMCQLEMQMDVIKEAARLAKENHKIFILNPAPFQLLDDDLLSCVDYLTPNEIELAGLLNLKDLPTLEEKITAAQYLLNKGVKNVIVTLGSEGALLVNSKGHQLYSSYKVTAIDTVAAGDSFNGALASMIDQGKSIDEAISFGNAVGALTVQKPGAIPSLPLLKEVHLFLASLRK